jgi:hypothetical protein
VECSGRNCRETENCDSDRHDHIRRPPGPGALHHERAKNGTAAKATEQGSVSNRTVANAMSDCSPVINVLSGAPYGYRYVRKTETSAAWPTKSAVGSFRFSAVEPGNYKITIAASGFAVWTVANVAVASSDNQPLLCNRVRVPAASASTVWSEICVNAL